MAQPYIATRPIYVGTALGYAPGDVVADDVVKDLGVEDFVARAGTKSATAAASVDAEPQQNSTTK